VRILVLLAAVPALFVLNYLVLMPVYARDVLDVGAGGLGLLTAGVGVGALSGALTVAVLRPAGGSGQLALAGLVVAAVALVVFAVSRWLPLSLVALAVLGASQVAYYATTNTLIQVLVPARLRGRVMSLYMLTSLGVIPFGNLLAGLVAERFGPTVALAGGGVATIVVVGVVMVRAPELVRARAESAVVEAR
jgi:MFS-type transporter involved in bile tolerance (Atg22 family)